MPQLGYLISKLQVGEKTYNSPEIWNSKHKITKVTKKAQKLASIKANSLLNSSYKVCDNNELPVDSYLKTLSSKLDSPNYKEIAPWSTIFNKMKQIILFKK